MKFDSLKDILLFALAKEKSSVQFYKCLVPRVKNSETAAVFEAMCLQEEKHIEAMMLELFKLGYTLPPTQASKEIDVEEAVIAVDESGGEMTYMDALRLGLQKERAAFRLYTELMAVVEGDESREMFMGLAEEEMRHVLQFEREIEAFSRQKNL